MTIEKDNIAIKIEKNPACFAVWCLVCNMEVKWSKMVWYRSMEYILWNVYGICGLKCIWNIWYIMYMEYRVAKIHRVRYNLGHFHQMSLQLLVKLAEMTYILTNPMNVRHPVSAIFFLIFLIFFYSLFLWLSANSWSAAHRSRLTIYILNLTWRIIFWIILWEYVVHFYGLSANSWSAAHRSWYHCIWGPFWGELRKDRRREEDR